MSLTLPFRAITALGNLAVRLGKAPSMEDLTKQPAELRKQQQPNHRVLLPWPQDVRAQDRTVEGRDLPFVVRVYQAAKPSGRAIVYIHGGGFMVGGLDACGHICADLCHASGATVISVDYRLAPDDPFPAGLDDCEDALRWVLAHAAELGIDVTKIAVCGDSAGGNLSAALALRLKKSGEVALSHQVLIYPMLDLTCSRDSWVSEGDLLMSRDKALAVIHLYYGRYDVKDPEVSPLFCDDLSGLPTAIIFSSQHDTLRDDARDYAELLKQAGNDVTYYEVARMPHAYLSWPKLTKEYGRTISLIAEHLGR